LTSPNAFPAFDGLDGRQVRVELVRAQWPAFLRKLESSGLDAALAAFPGWLARDYPTALRSWERTGGQTATGGQHARSGEYREVRADPDRDPPPFDDFVRRRDGGETVDQICPRRGASRWQVADDGRAPRVVVTAFRYDDDAGADGVKALKAAVRSGAGGGLATSGGDGDAPAGSGPRAVEPASSGRTATRPMQGAPDGTARFDSAVPALSPNDVELERELDEVFPL
jgi:hypothetical protein